MSALVCRPEICASSTQSTPLALPMACQRAFRQPDDNPGRAGKPGNQFEDSVQAEKFATHEELEKQSKLLEELTSKFDEQNKVLDEQNTQMGIVQNDLGTVKTLQRDTLRAILKLAPDE